MTQLELKLNQLKANILEMMILAMRQLKKSKIAFLEHDTKLADEIIQNEKRMNALELSIDRDVENIFALYQPVASDLRFTISMLKINSDIERIGDYAEGIADYVMDLDALIPKKAIKLTHVSEMFDVAISMMTDIQEAFEQGDTALARRVYEKDVELNKINITASKVISDLIEKDNNTTRSMLFLFSTIRKLERTGDHIKNVAEDIIFHHEAEVFKHKNLD